MYLVTIFMSFPSETVFWLISFWTINMKIVGGHTTHPSFFERVRRACATYDLSLAVEIVTLPASPFSPNLPWEVIFAVTSTRQRSRPRPADSSAAAHPRGGPGGPDPLLGT